VSEGHHGSMTTSTLSHSDNPVLSDVRPQKAREWRWKTRLPFAAAHGDTNVLRRLRINGFPWEIRTATYAAVGGHVETLSWAHNNGGTNAYEYTIHEMAANA